MRFETTEQAQHAGLRTVAQVRAAIRDSGLQLVDLSRSGYGYRYGLAPLGDALTIVAHVATVTLAQETNAIGQAGSVTTMFRASAVDAAIEQYPSPPMARCNMCGAALDYTLDRHNQVDCHRCGECWAAVDARPASAPVRNGPVGNNRNARQERRDGDENEYRDDH
jgi:hypothetical protein